jgi:hypothetical protein
MSDELDRSHSSLGAFSELQEQGNFSRSHLVMYSNIPHFLAIVDSWLAPFVGKDALVALLKHVDKERNKEGAYTPFCSIVQSSGMGKSRLLDELSKEYFLIPINLREPGSTGAYATISPFSPITIMSLGYPPPDVSVRNLLTTSKSAGDAYIGSLYFLLTLFERTTRVITEDLKDAPDRSTRITKFREFMTNGQNKDGVGEQRWKFYPEIVNEVENVSCVYGLSFICLHFTENEKSIER